MSDELFAFVIMPFAPEFDAVYAKLIVPPLRAAGYSVGRADKTLDQRNILKEIIPNIARADLIIADITTLNANVFYELGIAHTLPKPVLMLIQDVEEIPFDLQSYRVIKYSVRFDKAEELVKQIQEIAEAHRDGKVTFENPVVDFIPQLARIMPAPNSRERAATESTGQRDRQPESVEEGDLGIIDIIAESEKAATEYVTAMNELTELTKSLTERQSLHTEALKALDKGAPGSASRLQGILKVMGLDMVAYSEKVNALVESKLKSLERLIDNAERLIVHPRVQQEESHNQLRELRGSFIELQATLSSGEQIIESARASVLGLGGFSRMLDLGVRRTEQAFDALKGSIVSAEARLARLVNLLDERLGP